MRYLLLFFSLIFSLLAQESTEYPSREIDISSYKNSPKSILSNEEEKKYLQKKQELQERENIEDRWNNLSHKLEININLMLQILIFFFIILGFFSIGILNSNKR